MRKVSLFIAAALSTLVVAAPLFAQENFTEGPVSRIILIHIKPGHNADFWNDVRQNLKPLYEEYKKQGLITDYHFFTKASTENPEDWNVGINLVYQNYGALDGLAAKTDPITLKFYGSREARVTANNKRFESATIVSSFLIRAVDPRPMTSMTTPKP
jgi:hypothetical protein